MEPRIESLEEKKLIGKSQKMTFQYKNVVQLWKSFMPRRKEIKNTLTSELIAMQISEAAYYQNFDPDREFIMWASVEVENFEQIPDNMQTFTLKSGLYAVFTLKGTDTNGLLKYIFESWIPNSDYVLDHRPHFQIMGEKYKNNDPNSEEDFWVPIKKI